MGTARAHEGPNCEAQSRQVAGASPGRVCIVHAGAAMVRLLTEDGPEQVGGAEVQVMSTARALARHGWEICFVVADFGQPRRTTTRDGRDMIAAFRPGDGWPLVRIASHYVPGLFRAMSEARADIYLLQGASWLAGPIARFTRRHGRRFVFWLASRTDAVLTGPGRVRLSAKDRWLYRYGLRRADLVVCQTQEQANLLQDGCGIPSTVVPCIWPMNGRPSVHKPQPPEVLWAARAIPLKRPHMALDAAERLPHVHFVLIGGAYPGHEELFQSVQARADDMPNVEVKGFIPFEQTAPYYRRASVLLCTSTIEGFPTTFLQAWANGAVAVSTYDPDDVLATRQIGFHCSDVEGIVDAIRSLTDDPSLRAQLAERAWRHLETQHSPQVVVPRLDASFRRILDSGSDQ